MSSHLVTAEHVHEEICDTLMLHYVLTLNTYMYMYTAYRYSNTQVSFIITDIASLCMR